MSVRLCLCAYNVELSSSSAAAMGMVNIHARYDNKHIHAHFGERKLDGYSHSCRFSFVLLSVCVCQALISRCGLSSKSIVLGVINIKTVFDIKRKYQSVGKYTAPKNYDTRIVTTQRSEKIKNNTME